MLSLFQANNVAKISTLEDLPEKLQAELAKVKAEASEHKTNHIKNISQIKKNLTT